MRTYMTIVMTGVSQYSDHSAEWLIGVHSRPIQRLCNKHLYQRYSGIEVAQTNDLHPAPRLRMRGAIPPRPTRLHCVVFKSTVFPSTDMKRIKPRCLRKIHRTFHFTVIKVHSHLRNEEKREGLSAIRAQKANCNTSVCHNKSQILTLTSTKFIY
jgi:hypothetical protein